MTGPMSPKFAANLTLLFADLPFLARFEAAAAAGFQAVECQFPYAVPAGVIKDELAAHELRLVLYNLPAGDWAAGDRGIGCHPDRVDEFRSGVEQALAYAEALDCPALNCLAGILPAGVTEAAARRTLVANLAFAAATTAAVGRTLLVESINGHDVPGFLLRRTQDAAAVIGEVGAPNLKLQLDLYHAAREGEDPVATIDQYGALIGHVQIADVPGRHEPGTGVLDFPAAFAALDRAGYAGWVGCEYNPRGATVEGLVWRTPYLTGRRT